MALRTQGIATLSMLGAALAAGILASQPDAATLGAVFADSGQAFAGMTMDEALPATTGGPALIFTDGFESGDLAGWSSATGGLRQRL